MRDLWVDLDRDKQDERGQNQVHHHYYYIAYWGKDLLNPCFFFKSCIAQNGVVGADDRIVTTLMYDHLIIVFKRIKTRKYEVSY